MAEKIRRIVDNAKILLNNNILIFWKSWNRLKLIFLLVFIFVIPVILYVILNLAIEGFSRCTGNTGISFLSFYGLIITIVGVFMSARVLISINQNETREVDEYLKMTFRIVEEAKKDSSVYIIAPTFCPGITTGNNPLLHRLYERMEQKNKKNNVTFIYAFLKFGTMQTLECENNGCIEPIDEIMKDCMHWEFYKQFYKQDYDSLNEYIDKKQFIERKAKDINEYYKKIVSIAGAENIHSLSSDYIKQDNEKNFNGFFLVANIAKNIENTKLSKGVFYMGTFRHDYKTRFDGNLFYNKHISHEMKAFIDNFIKRYKYAQDNNNTIDKANDSD